MSEKHELKPLNATPHAADHADMRVYCDKVFHRPPPECSPEILEDSIRISSAFHAVAMEVVRIFGPSDFRHLIFHKLTEIDDLCFNALRDSIDEVSERRTALRLDAYSIDRLR